MDLREEVIRILSSIGLKAPLFDIHYDAHGNLIGHVASDTFIATNDKESQSLIWNALKSHLGAENLIKILAIFHETPRERSERLTGYRHKDVGFSNYWVHQTPDLAKYWLFIGIDRIGADYKSFFLIVNQKFGFKRCLTFNYSSDVIKFMELEQNEIHKELYDNTFNNAEAEIKLDLMSKHDQLADKEGWNKKNIYDYVYESFSMKPVSKNHLIFTIEEISSIEKTLPSLDKFSLTIDIRKAINNSNLYNSAIGVIS
jgi:hypothetical protein